MNALYYLACALGSIAAALAFIGLGMRIANENNRKAWDKYYEGLGKKTSYGTATQYTANVVSMAQHRKVQ